MRARYVQELSEGMRVDATLLVLSKQLKVARTGDEYLALELADRSGTVPATYFRPSPVAKELPSGTVAHARGTVTRYRGRRRLALDELVPAESWDAGDLIGSSERDTDEVMAEFSALVKRVSEPDLRALLRAVFSDTVFLGRFRSSPASRTAHHAYMGGLIEHTVAVSRSCAQLCETYLMADRDVLLTAALLHDIGVVDELEFTAGIRETTPGRLLGHSVLGCQRVHEAARATRLAAGTLVRIEHAILAHHVVGGTSGTTPPSTPEAALLRQADCLDATVAGFEELAAGTTRAGEVWTDDQNQFGRPLFLVPVGAQEAGADVPALPLVTRRTA
jgi:3'-5' exoribonuclease